VPEGATHIEVEAAELALMLEGFDLSCAARRKRWRPTVANTAAPKQGLLVSRGMNIQRAR
jgi:transposase